jgi:sugar phosphate isomerase/epimerase
VRADQIALQLYTVRVLLATDLAGTLRRVADAGYRAAELAGLPPIAAIELAAMLADHGLQPVASHEPLERLREDPDEVARRLTAIGCPRAIIPSMPAADHASREAVVAFAAELGTIADRMATAGITLGYHNHAFEFEPVDGTTTWDVLTASLPATVDLEIDVYWAAVGGMDPARVIASAGRPIRLLHMKDRESGPEPRDAPVGSGDLPWPDIVQAGRAAGVEWYVVEQDEPRDPLPDVATSLAYLRGLSSGQSGASS